MVNIFDLKMMQKKDLIKDKYCLASLQQDWQLTQLIATNLL